MQIDLKPKRYQNLTCQRLKTFCFVVFTKSITKAIHWKIQPIPTPVCTTYSKPMWNLGTGGFGTIKNILWNNLHASGIADLLGIKK